MEFDRMLMSDDFINPVRHLNTKHIHPTMRNAKIIAPFFEDVTPEEMQRSLKSMIFYHKLFLVPEPAKRKALFMAMKAIGKYDALHGIVMSLEPNPALYAFEKAVCRGSTACGKSDPSISKKTVQWAAVTGKIPQDFWGGNRLGETAFIVKGGFYEFCDIR